MSVLVLRGDARELPLPDESVDLLVTSPPYFGLRSYTDGGEHYDGQIGSEATPGEYVAALAGCTREWVRVLKPCGSLFVNLGDKYNSSGGALSRGGYRDTSQLGTRWLDRTELRVPVVQDAQPKSLLGLPWRYAHACTDQLGLILRAEIIWAKPNGLPESVTDRVPRAHEQVFHFTLRPRYYSAVDEIREPQQSIGERHNGRSGYVGAPGYIARSFDERALNPLGKLPGSVWNIPSQPLTVPPHLGVDHFAAFPMELPRRIIAGWSPPGVCTACGEGRRPVTDKRLLPNHTGGSHGARHRPGRIDLARPNGEGAGNCGKVADRLIGSYEATITGYVCACGEEPACRANASGAAKGVHWASSGSQSPGSTSGSAANAQAANRLPPTRPAVVLDPFGGTGTTALLAHALGRTGITLDRSADYCRLAAWRTQDPAELARALEVPKPPPVPEDMDALF